jgi:hypothetical protein
MKGAIGNALLLNIVITFIGIFYLLIIGAMAYSKAFKVKNYLLDSLIYYDELHGELPSSEMERAFKGNTTSWNNIVYPFLSNIGYNISHEDNTCPNKNGAHPNDSGYKLIRDTKTGQYDYCIYIKRYDTSGFATSKYSYKVISYMKFDFPIVGKFMKLSMSGETKTITKFK